MCVTDGRERGRGGGGGVEGKEEGGGECKEGERGEAEGASRQD